MLLQMDGFPPEKELWHVACRTCLHKCLQEVALLSAHPAVSAGAVECCAQQLDDSGHKWSAGQTAEQLWVFFFFGPSSRTSNVAFFPLAGTEAAALLLQAQERSLGIAVESKLRAGEKCKVQ